MKKIIWCLIILTALVSVSYAQETAPDKGTPISIELRGVELKDVLRALSQEHGINIIVDDSVTGTVTVSIRNVPLWDAIDSILRSKGYGYRMIKSGLLLVEPLSDFAKKQEDVAVKEFKLKYLKTSDKSIDSIKGFLSERGQVIPVESTNSLIIKDLPEVIDRVEALVGNMDVEPAQIMIEAKIVEVSTNHSRDFGIQWSARYNAGTATTDFAVNLPISSATAAGTFGLGYVKSRMTLDASLSALEDNGNAKILSSPKIRVLENQEAVITSGEQLIVPSGTTTTTGGVSTTSTTTVDAKLELKVTPRSIGSDMVLMAISTKRDEFDRSKNNVLGLPPKLTREAKTDVIVKDGETIVIGGIYSKKEFKGESGVPFLSKIPLLGWLFKKRTTNDDRIELLIFLTPKIVKEEKQSALQTQ